MTQWDFQNKGKSGWTGKSSFALEVPLRHLRPSVIYSVPCDRILQRAYFKQRSREVNSLLRSRSGRGHATLPVPTRLLQTDIRSFLGNKPINVWLSFSCQCSRPAVIDAAYTMTTKREAHWSKQTKAQNTEKGMYVGLKQLRGDGERYVTPARPAAKETRR